LHVLASAGLNPRFQYSGGNEAKTPSSQETKANKGKTEGASGGKRKRQEETNEDSQEKKANKGKTAGASGGKRHGSANEKDIKTFQHEFLWKRCVPHCHLTVRTYTLAYIHTYIHTYICIYTKS